MTLLLGSAALPAYAQGNGDHHAQATLHLRINIVRVIRGHDPDPHENKASGAVLFDLPSSGESKMSETEVVRPLTSGERLALPADANGTAVLRTRTFVIP